MHRTLGDGYITDPVEPAKTVFADEDPPTRDATQLRHQEVNAYQEEIANVIEAEGYSLNADSETIQQMDQLNTAIDKKVSDAVGAEAISRSSGDAGLQAQITSNDSQLVELEKLRIAMPSAPGTVTPGAGSSSSESGITNILQFSPDVNGGAVLISLLRNFTLSGGPANYFDIALGLGGSMQKFKSNSTPVMLTVGGSIEVAYASGTALGNYIRVYRLGTSIPNGTVSVSGSIIGTNIP